MPAGAINPYQLSETTRGKPLSTMVGVSGSDGERCLPTTASAVSLPARMCSSTAGRSGSMICTCPPSRSATAGAAPRYGTCTILMLASMLNSSPVRWMVVPAPAEAKLTLPGLALRRR